jgi:hypothetical protein
MARRLSLTLLPDALAICRLDAAAQLPAWATDAAWWSITRTPHELSVVCAEACVPEGVVASRGWIALRFAGPLPLDQTGILASVTTPLAAARVSVLALATYDTDYVLVPAAQRAAAIDALERAGHSVGSPGY